MKAGSVKVSQAAWTEGESAQGAETLAAPPAAAVVVAVCWEGQRYRSLRCDHRSECFPNTARPPNTPCQVSTVLRKCTGRTLREGGRTLPHMWCCSRRLPLPQGSAAGFAAGLVETAATVAVLVALAGAEASS